MPRRRARWPPPPTRPSRAGTIRPPSVRRRARSTCTKALGARADAAWDLNAIGLANQYLGRYQPALDAYRRALELDRIAGARDGEITRLNNIGNVHFLLGRYSDALAMYQDALGKLGALTSPAAHGRLRKMTVSNLAALNQRLGADERALDFYAQLTSGETMQPGEEAQLLVNQGALARRLGDPAKALDLYRAAQRLFAQAAHRDGEIGAWRNIGIVYALDLTDYERALAAFNTALQLARSSSNRRGEAQALLYRGEVLRRIGRDEDARRDLEAAFDGAVATGLVEEQWKALYGIGLVAQARGDRLGARAALERAIARHRVGPRRSEDRRASIRIPRRQARRVRRADLAARSTSGRRPSATCSASWNRAARGRFAIGCSQTRARRRSPRCRPGFRPTRCCSNTGWGARAWRCSGCRTMPPASSRAPRGPARRTSSSSCPMRSRGRTRTGGRRPPPRARSCSRICRRSRASGTC